MSLGRALKDSVKGAILWSRRSWATGKAAFRKVPGQFPYRLSIAAIMKNEAPYVEEWIQYHLAVGVEHFYIYDNGSTDGMADILAPYAKSGLVTYRFFPGIAQQIPAYNDALQNYRNQSRYIAFIDTDEFLFPVVPGTTIPQLVDEILALDPHAGGVAVNWRMFGSSHLEKKPEGGVLKNFLWRAAEDGRGNDCIKTIVDPRKVAFFNHVHYPIYCLGWHSVDESGVPVSGWSHPMDALKKIRINHYFTKSKEEWIARRSLGRADSADRATDRTMEEFYQHDNNDLYDNSILPYAEHLKKPF